MVNVSMDDALRRLDLRVPASKKIRCPAHEERVPSLHVYDDHFYCFSCGANGDGIGLLALYTGKSARDMYRELAEAEGPMVFQRSSASKHLSKHKTTSVLIDRYRELSRTFWNTLRESWVGHSPFWQYDRTMCYWDEQFDDLLTLVKDDDQPGFARLDAIEDLRLRLHYELL